MTDFEAVFDRRQLRRQRRRAAARFEAHDFLQAQISDHLASRILAVNRRFGRVLELGAGLSRMRAAMHWLAPELYVSMDAAPTLVAPPFGVIGDEEAVPFAAGSFDLIVASSGLHFVNDLPGALLQLRAALRPDGLLLAALFGGSTLTELRQVLLAAESEVRGGAAPRIAPMAELSDVTGLLQRAGLALPVADREVFTVSYGSLLRLLLDLRRMGEGNPLVVRGKGLSRAVLARAADLYAERFATGGRLRATFEVFFLTGWAPHDSQQKPLAPGSARIRLAEALGTHEIGAGEAVKPNG